ncbi:MAG: hypothetical protein BWY43_00532 [candidate division WS2 bacterium ADurb.Bin280]|uniref:Uncharacterized protein n=1 Tax=candidate division WS2 bacterium ADurb.Bin280 TaxID=1852829 RepID=A0A1V5SDS0_9BACT|nr:MAG: hypothetical protein BWY43_00532 [candidate division WS2 bacterium ADurb.Bin280]
MSAGSRAAQANAEKAQRIASLAEKRDSGQALTPVELAVLERAERSAEEHNACVGGV